MKYVILIHSNPQPWGHPTSNFVAEHQALSELEREALESRLRVGAERRCPSAGNSLRGPGRSATRPTRKLVRWHAGRRKITDGPYAETVEHFAGFFLIDVESQSSAPRRWRRSSPARAETVELRPVAE